MRDGGAAHARGGVVAGSRARRDAGHAEEAQRRADRLRARDLVAQILQMAARQMAGLVRDDADHLVRRFRLHERAGEHHHAASARHEGVELAVLDEHDLGVAGADAGGAEDRLGIAPEQRLDLRVADDDVAALLRVGGRRQRQARGQGQRQRSASRPTREAWASFRLVSDLPMPGSTKLGSARGIPGLPSESGRRKKGKLC